MPVEPMPTNRRRGEAIIVRAARALDRAPPASAPNDVPPHSFQRVIHDPHIIDDDTDFCRSACQRRARRAGKLSPYRLQPAGLHGTSGRPRRDDSGPP